MCDYNICKVDEFPKITSAFFILTNQCVLKCRYCFVNQNPQKMSYKIALDATNFLIKNAEENNVKPSIVFFGGEPLMEWDNIIIPLTKYIREKYKKPFGLSITSNCVLITEDKLKFMKENNIDLLFSIDGDKKTQDYNRPFHNDKGSFNILEPKIKTILKYYPNVTFRATIHKNTCMNTFHDMKFAIDKGFRNMFFIPNVFDEWDEKEKEILKNQVKLFGDYFIENARQGKIIRLNNLDRIFPMIVKINKLHKEGLNRPIIKRKCGLGNVSGASISVDGKIYACQEMTTNDNIFEIGNIYDGENSEKRKRLSLMFNSQEIKGLNNCIDCKMDRVCDGGCVANNYLKNNNVNTISDMYCFWQQTLLEEAIKICNVLGNEKNELFKNTYFPINNRKEG